MSVQLLKSLSIIEDRFIPGCLCPGFRRGRSIMGGIDLGQVPFSELFSDEYIAHLVHGSLYFISQENRDIDGNFAARNK